MRRSLDQIVEGFRTRPPDGASHACLTRATLAKKLKAVVKSLEDDSRIPAKLARAIDAVADGQRHILAASIFNFHQYVHNEYVYPRAVDLYTTWDEISPFMEKVWP